MKIIALQAENFKKITAIEIKPDGNIVEITGKNGQGKTSVLDAIWVALGGMSAAPKEPIRKGADAALIRIDLGDIVVTRTFRHGKDGIGVTTAIKVESAGGVKYSSPQSMLDKLLGDLTFDPLAFSRMDEREQFNVLSAFVPYDFAAANKANQEDYDKRTTANRKAKEARAVATHMTVADELPDEPVSLDALTKRLDEAGKSNADIEIRRANRARLRADADQKIKDADTNRKHAQTLIDNAVKLEAEANDVYTRLSAAADLPAPVDTAAISREIVQAEQTNRSIEVRKARDNQIKLAHECEEAAKRYTEAIDLREVAKREAVSQAQLPIAGISFGDNQVLVDDLPFAQASDAEQLRVSIAIAMAMNPKLRVIRVRDGSLLDDDSMRLVAKMADEHDFQIWIERVSSDGKVGIILEDGHIKQQEKAE